MLHFNLREAAVWCTTRPPHFAFRKWFQSIFIRSVRILYRQPDMGSGNLPLQAMIGIADGSLGLCSQIATGWSGPTHTSYFCWAAEASFPSSCRKRMKFVKQVKVQLYLLGICLRVFPSFSSGSLRCSQQRQMSKVSIYSRHQLTHGGGR